MKMFNGRITAFASVAAILASVAAMPVSAVNVNAYSVSYETLTSAITTDNGNTIPAGAVGVTVSIEENTGFDGNTLVLEVANGYQAYTDNDDMLILQNGNVLANALISGSVSENGEKICIATAAANTCSADGELFTFYMTATTRNYTPNFVSVESTDEVTVDLATMSNTNSDNGISTCSWLDTETEWYENWFYCAGDANDDTVNANNKIINAIDASLILQACEIAPNHELLVSDLNDAGNWNQYFPSRMPECADANGNTVITIQDASDVLNYSSFIGAGHTDEEYSGYVGTVCQKLTLKS